MSSVCVQCTLLWWYVCVMSSVVYVVICMCHHIFAVMYVMNLRYVCVLLSLLTACYVCYYTYVSYGVPYVCYDMYVSCRLCYVCYKSLLHVWYAIIVRRRLCVVTGLVRYRRGTRGRWRGGAAGGAAGRRPPGALLRGDSALYQPRPPRGLPRIQTAVVPGESPHSAAMALGHCVYLFAYLSMSVYLFVGICVCIYICIMYNNITSFYGSSCIGTGGLSTRKRK